MSCFTKKSPIVYGSCPTQLSFDSIVFDFLQILKILVGYFGDWGFGWGYFFLLFWCTAQVYNPSVQPISKLYPIIIFPQ